MGSIEILTLALALGAQLTHPAGLTYTPSAAWKTVPINSSMRVAQFVVSRAKDATADAELVVYYFGGSGGSVDANIDRWIGQMQQPDGRPSSAVAKRSTRTVNGLSIALIDVSGTYVAEMTPGSSQRHNSPNFRLRAAVITTPNGPYFIKLTGPAATVTAADADFERFLNTVGFKR